MIALEDGSHWETILCHRESAVEDCFQFGGKRAKVPVPEGFSVLQPVTGTYCLENLHPGYFAPFPLHSLENFDGVLAFCLVEQVIGWHKMRARVAKSRPWPGLFEAKRDDVCPRKGNMHCPQILSVFCLDSPSHQVALAVCHIWEKDATVRGPCAKAGAAETPCQRQRRQVAT